MPLPSVLIQEYLRARSVEPFSPEFCDRIDGAVSHEMAEGIAEVIEHEFDVAIKLYHDAQRRREKMESGELARAIRASVANRRDDHRWRHLVHRFGPLEMDQASSEEEWRIVAERAVEEGIRYAWRRIEDLESAGAGRFARLSVIIAVADSKRLPAAAIGAVRSTVKAFERDLRSRLQRLSEDVARCTTDANPQDSEKTEIAREGGPGPSP